MKYKIAVYFLVLAFMFNEKVLSQGPINDSLSKSILNVKNDVDVLKRLKVNGWLQVQYQYTDSAGAANLDGGNFPATSNSRFMIRRGRFKFTYDNHNVQYVMQANFTERFVNIADFYAKITDKWIKAVSFQMGMMNRPFGFDIQQSSATRESPERSRYTQLLTPNERDMGAEIIFEAPKNWVISGLRFEGGIFNGVGLINGTGLLNNSITLGDNDSKKDFMGRLSYYKDYMNDKLRVGVGASNYYGYYRIATNTFYNSYTTDTLGAPAFKAADTTNTKYKDKYTNRIYTGVEGFVSYKSIIGTTTLRGEYVFGQQPGTLSESKSPQTATTGATYLRNFTGMYAYFIQRIGKSKHEVVCKYEFFDPNSKVAGIKTNAVNDFGAGDVKFTAIGLGYNFYINENYKLMFYYNMVTNELTKVAGYTKDLKDNVFTARVQFRF